MTRAGRIFPARGVNRGRLRYGREGADGSTLADWYLDRGIGMIELRLPWNLLNVTDPSSRRVLLREGSSTPFATAITDGFRFVAVALRRRDGTVMATLPAGGTYTWPRWETPRSHERLKPAYAAMQRLWESL